MGKETITWKQNECIRHKLKGNHLSMVSILSLNLLLIKQSCKRNHFSHIWEYFFLNCLYLHVVIALISIIHISFVIHHDDKMSPCFSQWYRILVLKERYVQFFTDKHLGVKKLTSSYHCKERLMYRIYYSTSIQTAKVIWEDVRYS